MKIVGIPRERVYRPDEVTRRGNRSFDSSVSTEFATQVKELLPKLRQVDLEGTIPVEEAGEFLRFKNCLLYRLLSRRLFGVTTKGLLIPPSRRDRRDQRHRPRRGLSGLRLLPWGWRWSDCCMTGGLATPRHTHFALGPPRNPPPRP